MPRENGHRSGFEPFLGGNDAVHLSGMEPSLSRNFGPLYGRFQVRGLEAPSVIGRRRPLVIIADHDPDTAHLIELIADSNGYDIRTTYSGLECDRLVGTLRPNLVVLNIRLAGLTGFELMRRFRRDLDPEIQTLPVLVMDVHSHPRDVMEAFEAGADDYLEKPYDLHEMLRCWRRVTVAARRPSPLTALQNEDAKVRQVALSFLLTYRPDGLVRGLVDLLAVVTPDVSLQIRWALRQLGTADAIAALGRVGSRGTSSLRLMLMTVLKRGEMDESELNGFEPRIGGRERFEGLTGQEPALGGGRRFDPVVWARLIDPRLASKETVVAELSPDACETYARVLIQVLPSGSVFSEKLADGLVLGGHFTPDQRAAAAHVLGLIGARAGGTLAQSIASPLVACLVPAEHEVVRVEAARALALLRDGRSVRPLIEHLESGSWRFRLAAIHALGSVGDAEALPVLLGLQQNGESLNEAMAALEALGILGGQVEEPVRRQIFEHLAFVFVRGDNLQRGAAARALGFLGEREALDLVIEAAIHGRGDFQCSAVQSLGIFGDPQAVPPLIGVLTSGAYHARQDAVNSLIQIGRAAIRPALAILRHPDPDVRRGAIEVLGKVGASEARHALVERLQDSSPDVRRGAVAALGMIGGDGAVEVLVGALDDADASVRKEATMMLSSFNDERVIGPLCLALWDADMTVRWFAAYALGVLKDARSVRQLCQALGDRSENVSRTAVDSLVRIGDVAVPVLAEHAGASTPVIRRLVLDAIERIGSPLARATLLDLNANAGAGVVTGRLDEPGH